MKLKVLVALDAEIKLEPKVYKEFEIQYFRDRELLIDACKEKWLDKEHALLIAATDATIALGKELGIATMAYVNPDFPNQSYSGVDMIVEGFEEVDADFLEKVYQRYHRIPWTILETDRCVIRELTLDDLDALFELYGDGGIDKYTDPLYPYEEEKEFQLAL